jgi:flagellum-specific peptidoglycan hydrolase FlgJ
VSSETYSFKGATKINPEKLKQYTDVQPITTVEDTKPAETISTSNESTPQFTGAKKIEVSNLDKLEYGWDKSTNVIGNIFRIGKAKAQDWMDEDKTFKDYILENEAKRKEKIEKEHWKVIATGNDKSGLVTVGEVATMLTDPYYIGGYYFGASALSNPFTSAALNAALIGGDTAIDSLAKTGEINWKATGTSAAIGAGVGAVMPVGAKIVKKFLPKATKTQAEQIGQWLDDKIAKKNNLTPDQLKKVQQVENATSVKAANNELVKWNANFFAPVVKEAANLRSLEKAFRKEALDLTNQKKELRNLIKGQEKKFEFKVGKDESVVKLTRGKIKTLNEKILGIRNNILDARKKSEEVKKKLINRQQEKLGKWSELVAKRDVKILEELRKTEGTVDWAVRSLLSATVKPLVGAGAGATFGILFGDEETDLMYWAAAGAAAGQMQKMIQRSARFGTQEKGKILGLIDREMVALNMQRVRSLLSSTTATKLNSYGGATEKISRMLLRDIDSSVQEKSAIAVAEQMDRYFFRKASDLVAKYKPEEIAEAVSITRGKEITKNTPQNIQDLAKGIRGFLDEFSSLSTSAGFFPKKVVENYFPRVLDWGKINQDPEKFKQVLVGIYKSLDVKGTIKNKKSPNFGRDKAVVAAENYIAGHKAGGESVFNRMIMQDIFGKGSKGATRKTSKDDVFVTTPVSEHITHERTLNGPYKLVEKVLEDNGYLVNDAGAVLSNLVNKSTKSIAFARQFGTNGELLKPFFLQIRQKYLDSGLSQEAARKAAIKESNLVIDTIDAYFDRYGQQIGGAAQASASILATLSNLNMLGRVTISSLGDLVQPFQNSSQFASVIKGWQKTALRAKNESNLAKALNYDISNELQQSLIRTAGMKGDINSAVAWMGERPTQKLNNLFFKGVGLEWLTGYARRFAYNTGTSDAYSLSKKLANMVNKGVSLNSNQAQRVVNFLQKYGINSRQALQIGEAKTFNDAIKVGANKKLLEQAGIITANRDALLPQVSNRLLFTQSQNPWVRIWGQFLSWAMAKSAQTNKILGRIENGNAKTLVKTLSVIPIYSGIQSLRELAKYGEVVTDYDANNKKWWAEGGRLSGQFGWLPELVVNRFAGPGSRERWYTFAPFFQFLNTPQDVYRQLAKGDKDAALKTLSDRVVPLPNWRRTFMRLFADRPKDIELGGTSFSGGQLKPFNIGGLAAKAITKAAVKRGDTAISTTIGTYKKVNKLFDDAKVKTVHDFGSGLGLGSKEFVNKRVTSHEPFVELEKIIKAKGKTPDYKNIDDVLLKEGFSSKDGVVNLNVLNVIEDPLERANVVKNIAQLINKDGMAVITTRGKEVATQAKKSKNAVPFGDGYLFGSGDKKTFQKGYGQKELEEFIKNVLGDMFTVEKIPNKYKIGTSGVIIKKAKPTFNKGGEIIVPMKKPEVDNELPQSMTVDTTTGEGANINIIEEEKPTVEKQVEKLTSKKYDKVSELEPNKKAWLFNTAEKVYKTNTDNIIPNDIILAINSEETGWGTSRFVKDGSNNLFNIQVFSEDEPHIKAKSSNAKIKKYESEEDSIKDFLNMVANSEKYQGVRETINAYNEGKATKNDIVDAIGNTGYAENPSWSNNVKSILNRRISGKNKEELKGLYNSIFVDKE